MTIYYSKTSLGFHNDTYTQTVPSDGVVVTEEQYTALLMQNTSGKVIVPDVNGFPIAIDPVAPVLTDDQNKTMLLNKIKELEIDKQPRALRDALLSGDLSRLKAIEDEISLIRTQL